ncbi:MAG: hypothetical protein JWO56_192 [Acidobacteria bacterium]|nr:hypothetical protein [Acidobacteriota bacterium]
MISALKSFASDRGTTTLRSRQACARGSRTGRHVPAGARHAERDASRGCTGQIGRRRLPGRKPRRAVGPRLRLQRRRLPLRRRRPQLWLRRARPLDRAGALPETTSPQREHRVRHRRPGPAPRAGPPPVRHHPLHGDLLPPPRSDCRPSHRRRSDVRIARRQHGRPAGQARCTRAQPGEPNARHVGRPSAGVAANERTGAARQPGMVWLFPTPEFTVDRRVGPYRQRIQIVAAREEKTLAHYDASGAGARTRRPWLQRLLRRG